MRRAPASDPARNAASIPIPIGVLRFRVIAEGFWLYSIRRLP
jgi:hypothetical protein